MSNENLFTVCASSNLLETNKQWDSLKHSHKLTFESYGDFTSPLFKDDDSGIVMVLFLEDLVPDLDAEIELMKEHCGPVIKMLENKALSSSNPIILCWGKDHNQNVLDTIKDSSGRQKFYNWFTEQLTLLRDRFETIYLVHLNEIFYPFGANEMFCERNWYFARCRLSIRGLEVLTDTLTLVMHRLSKAPSKVLVLDCDNTLWGGVVGEDGVKGILLGQDGIGTAFVDFQKEIVRLANNGVIIVLASKNNEQDVWDVFDRHSEMLLKREHIVASKINWVEKAINLKEIAQDLNLNLDSFAFWDDNQLERDKMKILLPQVLTIDAPKNIFQWPRLLRTIDCFAKFKITKDDRKKSDQYKARSKFTNDIKSVNDIKTYLASLELSPAALSLDASNIARAEQLCMKTNQFNIRTKRHSASTLQSYQLENDDFVFLVRLTDTYGDHGIVSLVCLRFLDNDTIFLDTFLMSCRVLGRHLEAWVLAEIVKRVEKNGARYLITEFVNTERNAIVLEFLNTYGFRVANDQNYMVKRFELTDPEISGVIYCLDTKNIIIPNIEVYKRGE